ncbi:hypothetical protein [Cytobacillus oceanisediminis]|uniref:hypothetical protein n=1 Tax=Cytobacillus oceanisediminis TaxID=665099 RepID=UPI00254EC53B|nr:hypothetical protein [Cytobacillus oceanisediminis]MDK7667406.1 hypothetical protein [Cytobacillus oceanisediminis]
MYVAVVVGGVYGAILSLFLSFLFMGFGQSAAGGFTSLWGEKWLYSSTLFPFIISFSILGFYLNKRTKQQTNKKKWIISFLLAFLITLYSGTVGALFGEFMVRGTLESMNISGTFTWGSIYSIIFLPVTTVIAYCLIYGLEEILKRFVIKSLEG